MNEPKIITTELAVIGTGFAGSAATLFAHQNSIKTVQIGISSEIIFASGYLDLMGIHPIDQSKTWENPFQAIKALVSEVPDHPYGLLDIDDIKTAFETFLGFMADIGIPYRRNADTNTEVLSPVGTVKLTYGVPDSMWQGAVAMAENKSCLILDFRGLKGFSAVQVAEMLRSRWPGIQSARISFPVVGPSIELYPEPMARYLEGPEHRIKLAENIKPHLNGAKAVGLPAILGVYNTSEIIQHLESMLGVSVFEIPTMPPSLPGLRMKEKLETAFSGQEGIQCLAQRWVLNASKQSNGKFQLDVGDRSTGRVEYIIEAEGVIFAGGRFLGRGLQAGRKQIFEPLFNLSVFQPENRADWHQKDAFDPKGHPINQAGVEVDRSFRPLDKNRNPVFNNLFAAGSILAHQDWARQKCGAGIAIATAYAAVNSYLSAT
jgi:glycerol-3-phosphate dehydrogenase subunit B